MSGADDQWAAEWVSPEHRPSVAAELRLRAESLQSQRPTYFDNRSDLKGLDFGLVTAIRDLRARADELNPPPTGTIVEPGETPS